MPILKVSDHMQKYSREGIVLPVISEPIDYCPQCGVGGYADGICSNGTTCGYIDPRVLEAIQAWQKATQVQQAVEQKDQENEGRQKGKTTKANKFAFITETPDHYPNYFKNNEKTLCKKCRELSLVDGECKNCGHEVADSRLDDPKVDFTGIAITDRRIKIPPTHEVFSQSKSKKNNNKKRTKASKLIEESIIKLNARKGKTLSPKDVDPGAMLYNSIILSSEPIERIAEMLDASAQMEAQKKINEAAGAQNGKTDDDSSQTTTSEELQ